MRAWLLAALLGWGVPAQAETCEPGSETRLFWGDLHVHTSYSMDAYVWNNQRTPADAYAFAKGGVQTTPTGAEVQLKRPLDFAAVTDHAEYFGLTQQCQVDGFDSRYCADLRVAAAEESRRGFTELFLPALLDNDRLCQDGAGDCRAAERNLWRGIAQMAHAANEPCRFTAFVANEWTASPGNLHWHRNLIYANEHIPERAVNAFDEPTQEAMWQALDERCAQVAGCDVLAIPHNSNIGMGGSFRVDGHSSAELKLRAKFEKLVELHQHKGASECYTSGSFTDEACGFEHMLPIPILRSMQASPRELSAAEQAAVESGYVRPTLAKGLSMKARLGVNPFVYGFIGSTDTHAARPGDVDEANWQGAIGTYDEDPDRRKTFTHYNPGGLVAAWARANTREEIFAALKRREVYATSGPRIALRFAVSEGPAELCSAKSQAAEQPMGSSYGAAAAPTFKVHALADEVPLARIEIVKLSYVDGQMKQEIQRFAATPAGRRDWCVAWTDQAFDPAHPSAWYARVLQQPTPRWDGQRQVQERAWSSPIWSVAGVNDP